MTMLKNLKRRCNEVEVRVRLVEVIEDAHCRWLTSSITMVVVVEMLSCSKSSRRVTVTARLRLRIWMHSSDALSAN